MTHTITSIQNPLVKHLVRLRQNRDYREEHKSVLIEGLKMVSEACSKGHALNLLTYDLSLIPKGVSADNIYTVNEAVMHKISSLQQSEGLVAEIPMPLESDLKNTNRLIVLDGISDPGNLGALLRSALALGWDGAYILKNSCDPYNDKALRAAKGATFRLDIRQGDWKDLECIIKRNTLSPLVADIQGKPIQELKKEKKIALVLGNEARGPSAESFRHCTAVTIPMSQKMESLNVAAAGAILMFNLGEIDE